MFLSEIRKFNDHIIVQYKLLFVCIRTQTNEQQKHDSSNIEHNSDSIDLLHEEQHMDWIAEMADMHNVSLEQRTQEWLERRR